ncbi:restriction endonuclease subunit S [Gilliamella sp. B2969]|uniref:restriction endonuclease subunit S n=1 Tax=Gilliamella sp. B2969 TaxID=2818021 RepID=UPI00226A76E9|nr:restriction endonuclease subunit S [Gilliamella sp. B2969]MCX8730285.1 restriction endonuclease subunit S [Gilliamella sp. B2969]
MSNVVAEASPNLIPIGYKQTEVGVIPKDWEVKTIFELVNFQKSLFDDGDWIEAKHITNKGIRLIQTGNIGIGRYVEKDAKKYIFEESFETLKCKELYKGDLLICRLAEPAGRACVLPDIGEDKVITSVDVTIFRPSNEIANREFYNQYFSSSDWFKFVLEQVGGTTHKRISRGSLGKIPVVYPEPKEQTAIANALSDVDLLITELEKLIAKKQAIKTATMQQLLTGRTRLPQFTLREDGSKKGTKQSELGEIPEDWEICALGDIGQTFIGLTYSPNDVADFGTLVLRSSNVQNGKLAYVDNVYVNMELSERVIVKQGDILVCVRNGSRQLIGKCALIDKNAEGSAFGAFMSIFRTRYSVFVFYQFQSDLIQKQINEIMGATINQITNKDMFGFKIILPDEKEQTAIATILSDMDEEIQALEQRLNKTCQIKQGMMQELLTGRTRLV